MSLKTEKKSKRVRLKSLALFYCYATFLPRPLTSGIATAKRKTTFFRCSFASAGKGKTGTTYGALQFRKSYKKRTVRTPKSSHRSRMVLLRRFPNSRVGKRRETDILRRGVALRLFAAPRRKSQSSESTAKR